MDNDVYLTDGKNLAAFVHFVTHLFKCTCFLHSPETQNEQIPEKSVHCVKFMQMCHRGCEKSPCKKKSASK